jgi:hypothetical protein
MDVPLNVQTMLKVESKIGQCLRVSVYGRRKIAIARSVVVFSDLSAQLHRQAKAGRGMQHAQISGEPCGKSLLQGSHLL